MTWSTWEHRRRVARGERVDRRVEQLHAREPQQRRRTFVGEALVTRAGDELVEDRERVAHRPAAGARDEPKHSRGDGDTLRRDSCSRYVVSLAGGTRRKG
jgi:hypothetical protein